MKSGGNYATILRRLTTILRKVDPNFDVKNTIEQLAGECSKISTKSSEWNINLKNFSFPSKTFKESGLDHVHPRRATDKQYKVVLSLEASGSLNLLNEDTDPIKHLAVNVVVTDTPSQYADSIFCAWHLDSHPPKDEQEVKSGKKVVKDKKNTNSSNESSFAHPRYHWQYGGRKVWENNSDSFFGSHLLLESPRLPHPPLDVVLAIDFIFANYYGKQWRILRSDTEYQRIIKEAQERYWKPYFSAIQSNWTKAKSGTQPIALMPFFYL